MISGTFPLVMALALTAGQSEPFAISCGGISISKSTMSGRFTETRNDLSNQVYVFDEAAERVDRALFPRQEFDPICKFSDGDRFVSFSPGLIRADSDIVSSDDTRTICSFEVDRMTGKAESILRLEWPDGRYHDLKWDMVCEPTSIPIFDLSKRKF